MPIETVLTGDILIFSMVRVGDACEESPTQSVFFFNTPPIGARLVSRVSGLAPVPAKTLNQHGPAVTHVSDLPLHGESPVVINVVVKLPLSSVFGFEFAHLAEVISSDPVANLVYLVESSPAAALVCPDQEA